MPFVIREFHFLGGAEELLRRSASSHSLMDIRWQFSRECEKLVGWRVKDLCQPQNGICGRRRDSVVFQLAYVRKVETSTRCQLALAKAARPSSDAECCAKRSDQA